MAFRYSTGGRLSHNKALNKIWNHLEVTIILTLLMSIIYDKAQWHSTRDVA